MGKDAWLDRPHLDGAVGRPKYFVDASQTFSEGRIEMIFDCIVCAARQKFGDLSPPVAEFPVFLKNDTLLLLGPRQFTDGRVEVVVPALSALFPSAFLQPILLGHPLCDFCPAFRS